MTNPRKAEKLKLQEFRDYLHYRKISASAIKLTDQFFQAQVRKDESEGLADASKNFSSVDGDYLRLNLSDLQNSAIVGDFAFQAALPGGTSEEHLPD